MNPSVNQWLTDVDKRKGMYEIADIRHTELYATWDNCRHCTQHKKEKIPFRWNTYTVDTEVDKK